jgi:hypothetical protein
MTLHTVYSYDIIEGRKASWIATYLTRANCKRVLPQAKTRKRVSTPSHVVHHPKQEVCRVCSPQQRFFVALYDTFNWSYGFHLAFTYFR